MAGSINDPRAYHNELSRLAEERHRMRQLERVRDTQEEIKVRGVRGHMGTDHRGQRSYGHRSPESEVIGG